MSGRVITWGLLLISIIFISTGNLCALEKPFSPIIYSDGRGGLELYWFYPGLHRVHAGNDFTPPLQGEVADKDDKNWYLITPFHILPPVYVESVSSYILNRDYFPEWTGDQFTPIDLALIGGFLPDSTTEIWRDQVAMDSANPEPYQKIERMIDLPLANSFMISTAFQWLPRTPSAPAIGKCLGPPHLKQFIYSRQEGDLSLQAVSSNLMTGLTFLNWQGSEVGGLNFRIRFSENEETLAENSPIIGETAGDSLHVVLDGILSGFAMIEVSDGQGNFFSDIFPITADKIAPLVFDPPLLNSDVPEEQYGECRINMANVGDFPMAFTWHADTLFDVFPVPACVIPPGETESVVISYRVPEDSTIANLILDFGDSHYPVRLEFLLVPRNPTDLELIPEILPSGFEISQPFPNPFNSAVTFKVVSDNNDKVDFRVFNLLGQQVFSGDFNPRRERLITWSGVDNGDAPVGSGVYFFVFSQDNSRIVRKAILLK